MLRESSRFFVLSQLQELSKESDKFAEQIPQITALDVWFSSVRETVSKIKKCTSMNDVKFFPDIKSVFCKKQCEVKDISAEIAETRKENIHAEKNAITGYETTENNEKNSKTSASKNKDNILEATVSTSTKKEFEKIRSCSVLCKKIDQELLLLPKSTPEMEIQNSSENIPENNCKSHQLMETPINRTFNKLINNTITLDSASSCSSNQKLKIGKDSDMRITRSNKKKKLPSEANSNRMQTRSGSKRKSSIVEKESSKKQKTGICDVTVSISATKAAQTKPHNKKNILKSFTLPEVKSRVDAVIVPTMKQNTSLVISKEKQLLEEIQKREVKAKENRKKVLAERQLKAAENKKKRDEKMEKNLQKRLQIEKERLEKKETEKKKTQSKSTKESVKKPALKTRTKELISEHIKENKSKVSSTSKQNETIRDTVFETPNKSSPAETETYDLTPMPDSSTYEFSDEEERPAGKPIPVWAVGVHLKSALIHQFYNPPNTDEIFGSFIESPDLSKIFYVQKKQYRVRTSSAVWNSPPNRSFHH